MEDVPVCHIELSFQYLSTSVIIEVAECHTMNENMHFVYGRRYSSYELSFILY